MDKEKSTKEVLIGCIAIIIICVSMLAGFLQNESKKHLLLKEHENQCYIQPFIIDRFGNLWKIIHKQDLNLMFIKNGNNYVDVKHDQYEKMIKEIKEQ